MAGHSARPTKESALSYRLLVFTLFVVAISAVQPVLAKDVLVDDFSKGLVNWETGKHAKSRPGKPVEVTVKEGQVVFPQHREFIVTKDAVEGDFLISFDVYSSGASPQDANLWIQLTAAPEFGGIFRFRYGADARESINLGLPPREDAHPGQWDGINDGDYPRDLTDISKPQQGKISFNYVDGKVAMSYVNDLGQSIETPYVATQDFDSTKIKIWGNKHTVIDNVRIVSLEPEVADAEPGTVSAPEVPVVSSTTSTSSVENGEYAGEGFVTVGGKKYPLRMGCAGTSSHSGIALTGIMISPDEQPEPVIVNLNIMHTDPDNLSGVYEAKHEDSPGSFSGSVTVYPGREGREFSTYVYTEGRAEIKQVKGKYEISFVGKGADVVGAGANHPLVYMEIVYSYSGDLLVEKH